VICEDAKRERVWLDPYWEKRDPAAETRLRNSYRLQTTIKYHQIGASDVADIAPDTWSLDQYYLDLPGRKDIQAELMFNFGREHARYDEWQAYLKRHRPPLLVLWGRDSPVYSEFHAYCYKTADPAADIHFYKGGHFLIDEHAEDAAKRILALAAAK
jgi:pimeloyl-ACP methyl ester carboxylesterase